MFCRPCTQLAYKKPSLSHLMCIILSFSFFIYSSSVYFYLSHLFLLLFEHVQGLISELRCFGAYLSKPSPLLNDSTGRKQIVRWIRSAQLARLVILLLLFCWKNIITQSYLHHAEQKPNQHFNSDNWVYTLKSGFD